ncbi:MAG: peptidylprolyl isomerase [Myxococcota bacterium]
MGQPAVSAPNAPLHKPQQFPLAPNSSKPRRRATRFGAVVDGMDVVDAISAVETHSVGVYEDVPVQDVIIESITVDME